MKLAELFEGSIDVDFQDDSIMVTYDRKRVPIYHLSQDENKHTFSPTRTWRGESMTVTAPSRRAAYNKVKREVEKEVLAAFGRAGPNAKRVSKKLGILG